MTTWICEACDFKSSGATAYQHMKDATAHWMGMGWPHVVRPVKEQST